MGEHTKENSKMRASGLPEAEDENAIVVVKLGADHFTDDSVEVFMKLWGGYTDDFETRLFKLVERAETTKIDEDDGDILIRIFSKYPARPVSQSEICPVIQGNHLYLAWYQWAEHADEKNTILRDSLARDQQCDHKLFNIIWDKASEIPSLDMASDPSPKSMSLISRALLYIGGVSGAFAALTSPSDQLVDHTEKLYLESGSLAELVIRLKSLELEATWA